MSYIPEFHGNPNDLCFNPEYVFKLKEELETVKKQRDRLANFNPDWDMLEVARDSLREHMTLCNELKARNESLEKVAEKAKDVIHNNTGSGWSNTYLDEALDALTTALEALKEIK